MFELFDQYTHALTTLGPIPNHLIGLQLQEIKNRMMATGQN
jgi:hypothetical protein